MNVRKPVDYSTMFATLIAANLPQMELYCKIGRLISSRPEKGAAVAAGYLTKAYPDASGFSPRNLRRMRGFYRAYKNAPGTGLLHARDYRLCLRLRGGPSATSGAGVSRSTSAILFANSAIGVFYAVFRYGFPTNGTVAVGGTAHGFCAWYIAALSALQMY